MDGIIELTRPVQFFAGVRRFGIEIDGVKQGKLKAGGKLTVKVSAGEHTVRVPFGRFESSSMVPVSAATTVSLEVYLDTAGMADNALGGIRGTSRGFEEAMAIRSTKQGRLRIRAK